jgi:hypothetical protein
MVRTLLGLANASVSPQLVEVVIVRLQGAKAWYYGSSVVPIFVDARDYIEMMYGR